MNSGSLRHEFLKTTPLIIESNVLDWVVRERSRILAGIDEIGLVRIGCGTPLSVEGFADFSEKLFPAMRDYIGGTSPRTRVCRHVMSATETPDDWSILIHQEMAYTKSPPDYIAFFSQLPAEVGGESVLCDMRLVSSLIDSSVLEKLNQSGGVRLRRALPSEQKLHLKPGVRKAWTEVFDTHDRDLVMEMIRSRGWDADWIDDDVLLLYQDIVPVTRKHPNTGHTIWSNQIHFWDPGCMIRWAKEDGRLDDAREIEKAMYERPNYVDMPCYADGTPVEAEVALHIYDIVRNCEFEVELKASEILALDNLRIGHGRRAVLGRREMFVALGDRRKS